MASTVFVVTDEGESYESINVDIKLSGIDLDEVNSVGKVFRSGDTEYPISRFGTWAIKGVADGSVMETLVREGGIAAAITWAFSEAYSEVTVWVKSIQKCRFSLDIPQRQKESLLDDIATGQMAKQLEMRLESLGEVKSLNGVKVKMVELVESDSAKKSDVQDIRERFPEAVRLNRLAEMERAANLMKNHNYSEAFTVLSGSLQREKEDLHRLQIVLRLSICGLHLKKNDDWTKSVTEIQSLFANVAIPAEEIMQYQADYNTLFQLLLLNQSAVLATEVSFAFAEVLKNVPDSTNRLDNLSMILNRIARAMKQLMKLDPCACLKSEHLHNIDRMAEQIEFMKKQTDCNPLFKSQCVYYAEFTIAELRSEVDKKKDSIFRDSSMEFKRLSSCWADLPFVYTRLRLHPEVRKYLEAQEFRTKVQQICKNPSLLKQYIHDSKIAKANEVLMSEFGLFSSDQDILETLSNPGLINDAEPKQPAEKEKPLSPQQEAQREKEKGNEAYKNQDFLSAHFHYDKAISLDPQDGMLHSNKAAVFISQENYMMARVACLKAIELVQNTDRHNKVEIAKIIARLARVEHLDKEPEKALSLYQQSLSLNFDQKVDEQKKECEAMYLASKFMGSPFAQ